MYRGELTPEILAAVLGKVEIGVGAANRSALAAVARAVESEVKSGLAQSTHPYVAWGQRTTARPGGPPALVSGTLRRSVTHTPVRLDPFGLMTRVGTGAGFFPWYGKGRTPSSQYGRYLETGLRNGATYPWLKPPAVRVMSTQAPLIWRSYFKGV